MISPYAIVPVLAAGALLYLALAWKVSTQARKRGYSVWVWMLMSFVTLNPILVLIVLTMLPDRRRMALRDEWRAELDRRLAAAGAIDVKSDAGDGPVPAWSLGNQETAGAVADRSLGDDETRGER